MSHFAIDSRSIRFYVADIHRLESLMKLSLFNRPAAPPQEALPAPGAAAAPAGDAYAAAVASKPGWLTRAQPQPLLPPERNGQPAMGGRLSRDDGTFCLCCCCGEAAPGFFKLSSSFIPIICCGDHLE